MPATWEPIERSVPVGTDGYPSLEAPSVATFEQRSGQRYEVPAFPDGDAWRVRFAPPGPGEWTWTVDADHPGGAFGVTPAGGEGRLREHGFIVAEGRELRHADGEPFRWLADTAWSAGAKATPAEWATYLGTRVDQGFTVVQVNALPQHDASRPRNRVPFVDWDLDRPDPAYFRALDDLVAACHDRGVVPALVALWYDYVAGENPDWDVATGERRSFDAAAARRFGRYLGARYGAYGTVWLLSGDASFAEGTLPVYRALAEGLRGAVTHPLCTVHMPGGQVTPEAVNDADWLDFHFYQSSHVSDLERPARQAEACRAFDPPRPVINGEPPYEGHGLFDGERRIGRQLARRAAWISLLAGANAGVTYGAHGVWQWHRRGEENVQAREKGQPDPWDRALSLPGARDYATLLEFLERFGPPEPRQELLAGEDPRVRAAEAGEALLAYTPHAERIAFVDAGVLAGRDPAWYHTATAERAPADCEGATVAPPPWKDDGLLVAR